LQLVGGEIRIEGNANGGSCDSDGRYGIFRAARQYDCDPIPPAYAESPQFPNGIVRQSPEFAIGHGRAIGSQDGIPGGGSSSMEGEKVGQTRKDRVPGFLAR
jgi:hypothetical protein